MICGAAAQTAEWQQIKVPPLPAFHPQEPKRVELPNGMVIFLQEDHELPLIDGIARIRGGVRSEPANKSVWLKFTAKCGAPEERKLRLAINSMIIWKSGRRK